MSEEALERVGELGESVSLRYALQLLAPASVLARAGGKEGQRIGAEEVRECEDLFWDAKRSAKALSAESGKGFIC